MRKLDQVPKKERTGAITINGHSIMAFLADYGEDGGIYVAEDIHAACGGDEQRDPSNYIRADRAYLEELALAKKCKINDLIGVRADGRYWCTHHVAVHYAGWLDKRVQVAMELAAIAFAKEKGPYCIEWTEKRSKRALTVNLYGAMVKKLPTPRGKDDGFKYAVMNAAIQDQIQGQKTSTFKELNKVESAADAYSNAMLDADMLARSITVSNVERKGINELDPARDEARAIARQIGGLARELLQK